MNRRAVALASGIAGFLPVLLVLRVLFLLAALDPEEERVASVIAPTGQVWSQGPDRPLYDREELYSGTAADAIRHSVPLPLTAYRFMPYGSGSLLLSLAAAPLYGLFGSHYLVFKILPLLVTLLGGVCWLLTVRDWLGERAARVFGLLYLLAPSVLVRTALIAKGDHAEAMAWIGLTLLLATKASRSEVNSPRRQRTAVATGLLAGLGVFITYSTVPVLAGVGIGALALTRARPRKNWLLFGVGFAAGLIPWLVTVVSTGGASLSVYGRPLGTTGGVGLLLHRMILLVRGGLLAGYDLPGGQGLRAPAGWIWLLVVVLGWSVLLRRIRQRWAVLLGGGTIAHLAAFCLSAPDDSSRYLIPGYPLFLIAAAVPTMTSKAIGRSRWLYLGPGLAAAAGLLAQLWVLAGSSFPALSAPIKGTDWPLLGEIVGQKLAPEQIQKLPVECRPFFWVGLGQRAFWQLPQAEWPTAASMAGVDRGRVWEGIGIGWCVSGAIRQERTEDVAACLARLDPDDRAALRRGLLLYPEEFFAPLVADRGIAGALGVVDAFPIEDRAFFRQALLRIGATLSAQGVTIRGGEAIPSGGGIEAAEVAEASGWALYRGGAQSGLRTWRPPAATWVANAASGRGGDEPAFYAGVAAAYGWDLATRSPAWILGSNEGPRRLADDLLRITQWLPRDGVRSFYVAAGSATAVALREPFLNRAPNSSGWTWKSAVPEASWADFQRGLEASVGAGRRLDSRETNP
jgi:hypothetical protein